MPLRLSVTEHPHLLVDAVASVLADIPADPFTGEFVTVPSAGVRSWLIGELSARPSVASPDVASPDRHGIVANIEFAFPATLIARAIGERDERWGVHGLTWAVHLAASRLHNPALSVDLRRARAIADLFDRYIMHRAAMLTAWEQGRDLDALARALPASLSWQPRLWRAVVEVLGAPSAAARWELAADALRAGAEGCSLPPRVLLVGLASIPEPHLGILEALAVEREVHLFMPTWSAQVTREIEALGWRHRSSIPVERTSDPSATRCRHPLAATWARPARESQLLALARIPAGSVAVLDAAADGADSTLLRRLQHQVRADLVPPGGAGPLVLEPGDDSVRWYRCHGDMRQAEVVRDAVVHLLERTDASGRPLYQPRDIAVMCPDPARFAPGLRAAFGALAASGAPAVPIRLADRSLRTETALMATVAALLDLIDGRFRASDVVAFAANEPVRERFGLPAGVSGLVAQWAVMTRTAWGLDAEGLERFEVPGDLAANTWRAGLDQLFVGAALADPQLVPAGFEVSTGPGGTVPEGALSTEEFTLLGGFAQMLHTLAAVVDGLTAVQTPVVWARTLLDGMAALCRIDADNSWQWRSLEAAVSSFLGGGAADGRRELDAEFHGTELATAFADLLGGQAASVRFDTGALTISSLTARRGVPHRVVVLMGLDGELSTGGYPAADDLIAATPCLGDRDARAELRSQLLDALLSAGDRLIITSNGFALGTGAPLSPAVPVAELFDLVDATAVTAAGEPASTVCAIDHPRHRWSVGNFVPGALGVDTAWSFDRPSFAAVVAHGSAGHPQMPQWPMVGRVESVAGSEPVVHLRDIESTLRNPVRSFLRGRLGVELSDDELELDDLIDLEGNSLESYNLRAALLRERLRVGERWDAAALERWCELQRRSGRVPPLGFGERALGDAIAEVDELLEFFHQVHGDDPLSVDTVDVDVEIARGGARCRVVGRIEGLQGSGIIDLRASRIKALHQLSAWYRLLLLTVSAPERQWEALLVGVKRSNARVVPQARRLRLDPDIDAAGELALVVDTFERIHAGAVPVDPDLLEAIAEGDVWDGADKWSGWNREGLAVDPWVRHLFGSLEYGEVLEIAPPADESGAGWSDQRSRLERWAQRIWGRYREWVLVEEIAAVPGGRGGDGD